MGGIPETLQQKSGSIYHCLRQMISRNFLTTEDELVMITVPHLGQLTIGFRTKPPSIAMNSCPQEGHFALENPVSIVSSLFSCTTSDATRIIHTVLHQLAASEHGHCSNEQLNRKFHYILHKPQSKM